MTLEVWDDGRLFVHSILYRFDKDAVKHYREVIDDLCEVLADRGVSTIYTFVDSVEKFKFNKKILGFQSNYEVWNDQYEVMRKDF